MNAARTPDGVSGAAGERQAEIARRVGLRDGFRTPLRTVAGFQLGSHGDMLVAAAILVHADTLAVVDAKVATMPADTSRIAGPRRGSEVPALLAVLAMLPTTPDLALVEAHGIAHPCRLGTAAHFGVAADLPCIGVATAIEIGTARLALHEMRGAFTPLRDGPEQIGWLLRSRPDAPPLVVSPGHRVSMPSAPELVMRFVADDRRPEPTRLARLLLQGDLPDSGSA